MASKAIITHQWSEGVHVQFVMQADGEHPDALDEVASRVLRMYRETVLEPDEAE